MPRSWAWISMKRLRPNIRIAGHTCRSIANWMGRCTVGRRELFGAESESWSAAQIQRGFSGLEADSKKRTAFHSHHGPNATYLRIRHFGVTSANGGHDGRQRSCAKRFLSLRLFPLGDLCPPAVRNDKKLHGSLGHLGFKDHAAT